MARALLWFLLALLCLTVGAARAQPPRRRFGVGGFPPRPPRQLPSRHRAEGTLAAAAAPAPSTTAAATTLPPPLAPEPPRESATQSFCASSSSAPTLASPDPSVGGAFGASLALDGAGQVLVVGAPGEGLDPALTAAAPKGYAPVGAGAAYFATRQSSCRWSPPHFLAPPSSSSSSSSSSLGAVAFGASVAASSDGSSLLVGAALLRRSSDQANAGYVRPIVYVADASTGDIVRQEAGQEAQGGRRVDAALLAAKDAGAVAAAVLSGDARAAVAHGAATSVVVEDENTSNKAVFSDVASVFVSDGAGFSRAGGLPIELATASGDGASMPLQLTGGLRLSLSGDARAAVASFQALYSPSTARGDKLAAPARVAGSVQVFSASSNGGAFALQQRLLHGGSKEAASVWGAAHALSDDGLTVVVLEANAGGGAGDAIHAFRRDSLAAPFAAAATKLSTNGEQAASLALSADGSVLAVGLASGRTLLFAVGGQEEESSSPLCSFDGASNGPAEARLASGEGGGALRLVVSTPGSPARVFVVRARPGGNLACPSGPSQELGVGRGRDAWRLALGQGGGAVGGSSGGGVAVSGSGRIAVVGAPLASLDERLPGSGGLFSYVVG